MTQSPIGDQPRTINAELAAAVRDVNRAHRLAPELLRRSVDEGGTWRALEVTIRAARSLGDTEGAHAAIAAWRRRTIAALTEHERPAP